jgi:hypothetical protein
MQREQLTGEWNSQQHLQRQEQQQWQEFAAAALWSAPCFRKVYVVLR